MSSAAVLDLDRLVAPVAGESPCGESLRWDPVYDEIRNARREEDKDALGGDAVTQADWPTVVRKASDALATRSKDLMLAGFLAEALVQLHGYAGLRDALRLINDLVDTYWEGLFPLPDGDDLEPRIAPIVWLTEADRGARLPNRLREVPLAPPGNGPVASWAFWKSRYVTPRNDTEDDTTYARRRAEAEERAKAFEQTIAATPLPFYATLREDIAECLDELKRLDTGLDQRLGRLAPGTAAVRQSLDECAALVTRIVKDKGGLVDADVPADAETATAGGSPTAAPGATAAVGPITSRDDALRRLGEVAAYFRTVEPHSPISYLVQRATAWGRMSLEELVQEIVKDSSTRDQIGELLGFEKRD